MKVPVSMLEHEHRGRHTSVLASRGPTARNCVADCDAELSVGPPRLCGQRPADRGTGRKPGVLPQPVDPPPYGESGLPASPPAWVPADSRGSSRLGHRELCRDGEKHSPDVTEVWNGPGRDRAA